MTHTNTEAVSDAALVDQLRRLVDDQEGGDAVVLVQRQLFNRVVGRLDRLSRRAANSAGRVGGWTVGIESAPVACTLLAAYFDDDVGEWIVQIFVAEKPAAPFTHWQFINSPSGPWQSSPAVEAEPVAWRQWDDGIKPAGMVEVRWRDTDNTTKVTATHDAAAINWSYVSYWRPAHPSSPVSAEVTVYDARVEAVRKAIYDDAPAITFEGQKLTDISILGYQRKVALAALLAVLEAIRVPDPQQIEAGYEGLDFDDRLSDEAEAFNKQVCGRVFTAMIDAALKAGGRENGSNGDIAATPKT